MNHSTYNISGATHQRHVYRSHFTALLEPLVAAGWEYDEAEINDSPSSDHSWMVSCNLTRSCMVVAATWKPDQDTFQFEPAPESDRTQATVHLRLTNMVDEVQPITRVSHGPLTEFDVEQLAGRCGVLEPTRFTLPPNADVSRSVVLDELYETYVLGDAVAWHKGESARLMACANRNPKVSMLIRGLMLHNPDVIPDPVPSTAALGIALYAWRHSPVENLHAGQRRPGDTKLTDALMMKLNIAATRVAARHISLEGVDWLALEAGLTNSRRMLRDGRAMDELFSPDSWAEITAAIQANLLRWQQAEALLGPRATLRLLSVAGSTSFTRQWWGQSWWPKLASDVARGIHEAGIELPGHSGDLFDLLGELPNDPDKLPDETLAVCIDLPGGTGKGLRWAQVERAEGRVLDVSG